MRFSLFARVVTRQFKELLGYELSQQNISTCIQSNLGLGEDLYGIKMHENSTHR